ncbi:hypothetical protein D8674_012928 [Pyrus ussuriensis x Pyrus communis]|uniref:Secreted protein n=1 Tax=Pyrus ussuriensis x Pyrus communis TaxID=2448454 RepID=A0A5N5GND6_9ROSA|nr:hypothetical protein D8674_012928 [Pyrus ussuriensis x Pyrus communis]
MSSSFLFFPLFLLLCSSLPFHASIQPSSSNGASPIPLSSWMGSNYYPSMRSETSFSGGLDFLAAFGAMGSVGMDSCWWRAMTAQYVGGSTVGTRC